MSARQMSVLAPLCLKLCSVGFRRNGLSIDGVQVLVDALSDDKSEVSK